MAKKEEQKNHIYSCEVGNGTGVYRGILSQINLDKNRYVLEIFKIDSGEKQVETSKKESVLVENIYARPVMKDLKPDEITKRAKAIDTYLKKNKITAEEGLVVDKKTKKSLLETDLKFPVEKVFVEERILRDTPVIKTEYVTDLELEKSFDLFTRISNKDVRNTITNYINTL